MFNIDRTSFINYTSKLNELNFGVGKYFSQVSKNILNGKKKFLTEIFISLTNAQRFLKHKLLMKSNTKKNHLTDNLNFVRKLSFFNVLLAPRVFISIKDWNQLVIPPFFIHLYSNLLVRSAGSSRLDSTVLANGLNPTTTREILDPVSKAEPKQVAYQTFIYTL